MIGNALTVERKHCQCQDSQRHFLGRAFDSLQLEAAQRELLLSRHSGKRLSASRCDR